MVRVGWWVQSTNNYNIQERKPLPRLPRWMGWEKKHPDPDGVYKHVKLGTRFHGQTPRLPPTLSHELCPQDGRTIPSLTHDPDGVPPVLKD